MTMRKVIVLGSTGMLGSMVYRYLRQTSKFDVIGTDRSIFDAERFVAGQRQPIALQADTIINCIGVIKPFCKDNDSVGVRRAIELNALFPYRLAAEARRSESKVIQIATDCVYSGTKGQYVENDAHDPLDVYGKTKSLGEIFDRSVLNIRCSIIGPEPKNKVSLLEWFLSNKDGSQLNGFAHHRWNGVTTLQFAKICERIIDSDAYPGLLAISHVHHFVPNSTVDKYELMCLLARIYRRNVQIKRVTDVGPSIDRTLTTSYPVLGELYGPMTDMEHAISEMALISS